MKVYTTKITPEIKLRRKNGDIKKVKVTNSQDVHQFFRELFDEELIDVCEQVMAIYLDNSNNTVGWFKVSQGGITGSVVDIRLVMKAALDCLATGIIIAHNHPSGSRVPSEADKQITRKLKSAGEVHDIKLLDHLILTPDGHYLSMADDGLI